MPSGEYSVGGVFISCTRFLHRIERSFVPRKFVQELARRGILPWTSVKIITHERVFGVFFLVPRYASFYPIVLRAIWRLLASYYTSSVCLSPTCIVANDATINSTAKMSERIIGNALLNPRNTILQLSNPYTDPGLQTPHPKISSSSIAMLSTLTVAIPHNGLVAKPCVCTAQMADQAKCMIGYFSNTWALSKYYVLCCCAQVCILLASALSMCISFEACSVYFEKARRWNGSTSFRS